MSEPITQAPPAAGGPPQPVQLNLTVPAQKSTNATSSTARTRRPSPLANPKVLIIGGLILVIVELALFGLIDNWVWWLVVNAVLVLLVFAAALAWRRRGKGGLLDKLLRLLGVGDGRSAAGRTGAARTGPGSGRGGGLRSLLPGGRGRGAGGGGTGGGRSGGRFRWPFGKGRKGGATGPGRAGGGTGKGSPGGRSGGRSTGRSGGRSGGRSPAGSGGGKTAGTGGGKTAGTGGGTTGGSGRKGRDKRPAGQAPGGWWNPWNWKGWTPGSSGKGDPKKPDPKPDGKGTGTTGDRPTGRTAEDLPRRPTKDTQRPADRPRTQTTDRPDDRPESPRTDGPRHGAGRTTGGTTVTDDNIPYSDDQSLQRWGANLKHIEQAIEQVAAEKAAVEAREERLRQQLARINEQAQTELPADNRLKAEVESLTAQAHRAATSDDWRRAATDAAVLPGLYSRQHEVDEARLAGERGGRHVEKRADVTVAEQDN